MQWPICMLIIPPMSTYKFVVIGQGGCVIDNDMKLKAKKSSIPINWWPCIEDCFIIINIMMIEIIIIDCNVLNIRWKINITCKTNGVNVHSCKDNQYYLKRKLSNTYWPLNQQRTVSIKSRITWEIYCWNIELSPLVCCKRQRSRDIITMLNVVDMIMFAWALIICWFQLSFHYSLMNLTVGIVVAERRFICFAISRMFSFLWTPIPAEEDGGTIQKIVNELFLIEAMQLIIQYRLTAMKKKLDAVVSHIILRHTRLHINNNRWKRRSCYHPKHNLSWM